MIGLPGSGKSSVIKNEMIPKLPNAKIVSSDDIIQKMADDQGKTYNEIFQDVATEANLKMWENVNTHVENGDIIIWDRTFINVMTREKAIDLLIEHRYMIFAVCFEATKESLPIIFERNRNRTGKEIPEDVIMSMFDRYERPTVQEGFSAITFIQVENK